MSSLVFIQGSSRGIGKALLDHVLATHPECTVVATRREVSPESSPRHPRVIPMQLDIAQLASDEAYAGRFKEQLAATLGPSTGIRQFWNVAGVLHPERNIRTVDTQFSLAMDSFLVNVLGPLRLASLLAPFMALGSRQQKQQQPSSAVPPAAFYLSARVGSLEENGTLGGWHSYRASKAAGNMIWRNLAVEWGRQGIRCLAVHPGFVDTEMTRAFHKTVPADRVWTANRAALELIQFGMDDDQLRSFHGKFYDVQAKQVIPF